MPAPILLFVALIVLIPLLAYAADQRRLRRIEDGWRKQAALLGLVVGGSSPALSMSGVLEGVEISLVQTVEHRYKQAPLVAFTARARLPPVGARDAVATYRTASRPVDDPLRHDVYENLVRVDGWVEYGGNRSLDPLELGTLLRRLARTARATAEEEAAQEERDAPGGRKKS